MNKFLMVGCLGGLVVGANVSRATAGTTLDLISGNGNPALEVYTNTSETFNFSLLAGIPTVTDLDLSLPIKKNHDDGVPIVVSLYGGLGATGSLLKQLSVPSSDFTTGFKQYSLDLSSLSLSAGNSYSLKFTSITGSSDDEYKIKFGGGLSTTSDNVNYVKLDSQNGESTAYTTPNTKPSVTTVPAADLVVSTPPALPAPEPTSVGLFAVGGLVLAGLSRRRK